MLKYLADLTQEYAAIEENDPDITEIYELRETHYDRKNAGMGTIFPI